MVTPPLRSERLGVLDLLRGIALLGMFLVHFSGRSSGGGALDELYQRIVALFFEERFWAMFGILFGVGFAIQFRRAEARGEPYIAKYLRRMAALAVFGFIAHAVFGFNVLLGYAFWGVVLILFRNWPTLALVVALIVSAASGAIYAIARAEYGVATQGEERYRAEREVVAANTAAFNDANWKTQDSTSYATVFKARLQHMRWFYAQWFSFLPVNTLTLFLLGLLGLRLGIFDRPEEHRRLIVGLMLFGAASWATEMWLLPAAPEKLDSRSTLLELRIGCDNPPGGRPRGSDCAVPDRRRLQQVVARAVQVRPTRMVVAVNHVLEAGTPFEATFHGSN